ncbi:LacI family DNA-binding transcriptional regulator [Isoptericola sp. b441]|uniref:LacI family DNA-binding transcriptional regulator n=1 Tax=Actinotalea lenta TaxID=3064654 RepID=A0ABT9D8W7_9CELL|nr:MULTISPECIES: LacI family DNA-binding transcriptional regulator [unclassified Isoptericola]MDO8107005.1 LacI family DNA-binding transcriptional regulator [Isoptericola sp. b441]MDO8121285.1 LacI family DNA-binding transcriptional regulator [Isoptericola sp. b490]
MGVTSADVARASGVSRTTVSYVLNGTPGTSISDATRQRVLAAAERLGYAPSATARALRRGTTDLVLVVLPHWPIGPVIDTLLDHLADDLAERGLSVLVHHGRGRPLGDLWRAVTPRTVVGLTAFAPEEVRAMRQAGIQVVGTRLDDEHHDPSVYAVSQQQIGRLQVEHLVARGRRRIGWAGTTDARLVEFAEPRLAGVTAACASAGLAGPLVARLELDVPSATRAVQSWRDAGVDAVAAYNDEVALAVLAGLRRRGLEVPGDVAVIGVDDVPAARLAAPPLTTVSQSIEVQALYLARATIAALDGAVPPTPPPDVLDVVVRSST